MKRTKKLLALLLALVMAMAMNISAFAATITVEDAVAGQTYKAYKLFDVTNSGDAYAYTTTNTTLAAAIQAKKDLGITVTETTTSGTYNVTIDEDTFNAADFAAWISENLASLGLGSGINSSTDGDDTVTINVDTGYYFVTSSVGSLCILDTATDDITIHEKNSVPSIKKEVYEDSTTSYSEKATIDVIDIIKYQLTVNTGSNDFGSNIGTGINDDYVITDTLPTGITYNEESGVIISGWSLDTDYTVEWDSYENTLTITLDADKLAILPMNTDITIDYEAIADDNLEVDKNKVNYVTLTYNNYTDTDEATVITYEIDGSAEGNTFTKVDASNDQPLKGVKFVLSNEDNQYATFDEAGYLTGWVASQSDATALVTDTDGHIYAYGLDADKYVLTETETLPGYNLLSDTITVNIAENGTVTYKYTTSQAEAGSTITVENNSGSLLPSTGGMGTTVIYMAGVALVIVAGVTLVVRRRMRAE